jgi:hypothetical protein
MFFFLTFIFFLLQNRRTGGGKNVLCWGRGWSWGGVKENGGRSEFKYDILDTL